MKRALADWLVCPLTGEPLSLRVDREVDGELLEGELESPSGRRYPITGGVPRMAADDLVEEGQRRTEEAFSAKWERAQDFGHEDKSRTFYVDWYLRRYKFDTPAGLREFLRTKRRILDAGTGVGRDTRLYAEHGGSLVFGVDISQSIDAAYGHLKHLPNVHLIQADLRHLPFAPGFFDFIACDQVLHHTRDTHESFRQLVTRLGAGGDLSIYVYRRKGPIREFADDHLRARVAEMSEDEAWQVSEQLTELGRALSDVHANVTVPDVPALGIVAGTYDVQQFIYWNMLKCYWNPTLNYRDSVITNFDWYRPRYANRHSADEVLGWFAEAGFDIITFDECDAGISVRGRKR